jgi:hypothetical protein
VVKTIKIAIASHLISVLSARRRAIVHRSIYRRNRTTRENDLSLETSTDSTLKPAILIDVSRANISSISPDLRVRITIAIPVRKRMTLIALLKLF